MYTQQSSQQTKSVPPSVLSKLSDRELVDRYVEGHEACLAEIVHRHKGACLPLL